MLLLTQSILQVCLPRCGLCLALPFPPQAHEFEDLRKFAFVKERDVTCTPPTTTTAASSGAPRTPTRITSPQARGGRLDEEPAASSAGDGDKNLATSNLPIVTFFRTADLAQNAVLLIRASRWRGHSLSQRDGESLAAQVRQLEELFVHCVVTLQLLLPHCVDTVAIYGHVLTTPITLILAYVNSSDWALIQKVAGQQLPRVRDALQKLAQVKATLLQS